MHDFSGPVAYVVADSRGDIEFHDRASFEEAMLSADPVAVVTEVSSWPDDESQEPERVKLCEVSSAEEWDRVVEAIRSHVRNMFMHGDCWHLALAMNRLYGLELVAVVNHGPDGRDSVSHVAAVLPCGGFLDVRGYLADEKKLCDGGTNWPHHSVRPITREEIVSILDGYAREMECDPVDWENPRKYPFASEAELIVRILLGEEAEKAWAGVRPIP